MNEIIKIMEIVGTVAFALSGSLVAISSELDIFGVIFIACITAFGGGMARDLLLGITPPAIFSNYIYFSVVVLVAVLTFIIAYIYKKKFNDFKIKTEQINNIFDAIGLAAFVVISSEVGYSRGFENNSLVVICMGTITGIGGGIFRDVLIDTTPYVFKKHIYAIAAILGSVIYYLLRRYIKDITIVSAISMLTVFVIRMLATKYRWSLPKIHASESGEGLRL